MVLKFQVLGQSGRDNALYLTLDSGQKIHRLLFDCGDNCLSSLSISEIQAIDHLLFSHFHMDHVSGFDGFFRLNYNRINKTNHIWGPPRTAEIMQHRFQGFMWNLYENETSQWYVHDIYEQQKIETFRFDACEAFAVSHPLENQVIRHRIFETAEYQLEAYAMNHHTPSMAYILREKPSLNINTSKLAELGLQVGRWLQDLKNHQMPDETSLELAGKSYTLGELRALLMLETAGQSLAYLTDFLLDEAAQAKLVEALQGCTYMICESQYLSADEALAKKNYHMTAQQVAETASKAQVNQLILFHISDRYEETERKQLLAEAQTIFPNSHFPEEWGY